MVLSAAQSVQTGTHGPARPIDGGRPIPSETLLEHLATRRPFRAGLPPVLAAEHTTLRAVDLPKASARARARMLAFAIEDGLGAPIDTLAVVELPRPSLPGVPLALVVDKALLSGLDGAHLPEVLALPRPADPGTWHLWCDAADRSGAAGRVLIRAGDGTGFAIRADLLPTLWARAGWPDLIALHGQPEGLPHTTATPPAPDAAETAFRLHPPASDPSRHAWRPALVAAGVVGLALVAHLGIVAADVAALGQRAEAALAEAQVAVNAVLPDTQVAADTAPLLARLAPRPAQVSGSDVLPMLSDASAALLTAGVGITFRRVGWGEGRLVALVLAPRLEDLQIAEEALRTAGFEVRAGAASAGDGGAEAEMTIERSGT